MRAGLQGLPDDFSHGTPFVFYNYITLLLFCLHADLYPSSKPPPETLTSLSTASSWNTDSPPGATRMGSGLYQSARAWVLCQILGCYVGGVTGNYFLDWTRTVASVYNQTDCWICSALPLSSASGLPWHLHAGNWTDWGSLRHWAANYRNTVSWDQIPITNSTNFVSRSETYSHISNLIKEQVNKTRPSLGYAIYDGRGWLSAVQIEYTRPASVCVERHSDDPARIMGWTPQPLCNLTLNITNQSWLGWQTPFQKIGSYSSPWGWLWVCGAHGWPYLPYNWTGRCTWGRPYLPATIKKTLTSPPRNWEAVKARHRVARASWWFYPLAIFLPEVAVIDLELQVTALSNHTAQALNASKQAIAMLNEETTQLRKVVLQNRMALDILTAAQGGTCALVGTECCVYVPDYHANISHTLAKMQNHIKSIDDLAQDPLSRWLSSLSTHWRVVITGVLAFLLGLFLFFVCLYCCCGFFLQCSSLVHKIPGG
nr:PREDICTED: endogenous retrovirus group PABLB member 1 Env polyprotein-like isoform X1 [Rhinolophus sinicus]